MKARLLLKHITFVCCVFFFTSMNSQNLLDTWLPWSTGSGNIAGFTQNGTSAENIREYGLNHIGEEVILWKAIPDSGGHTSGGWNSGWHNANHSNSHRFSVWIKKTNSNSGHTYLGFYANNSGSLRLNGTYNSNPYFFVGDLPRLNRWYLIVGFVHSSSYTSNVNHGRIYDGVTGEEVASITDFKLKNTVTVLKHRSYLYYDTNTNDRQYFTAPRIDVVNGNEPTINQLLSINDNSRIKFEFDTAGNQKTRYYCPDGDCINSRVSARNAKETLAEAKENIDEEEKADELPFEDSELLAKKINLYPNPTSGKASITINGEDKLMFTSYVNIYNPSGSLVQSHFLESKKRNLEIDLSNIPSGVYHIHLHLDNGKSITKRIIKN